MVTDSYGRSFQTPGPPLITLTTEEAIEWIEIDARVRYNKL